GRATRSEDATSGSWGPSARRKSAREAGGPARYGISVSRKEASGGLTPPVAAATGGVSPPLARRLLLFDDVNLVDLQVLDDLWLLGGLLVFTRPGEVLSRPVD